LLWLYSIWGNKAVNACVGAHYYPNNYYINNNKRRKTMREAYKVQNVNQHISKVGLIRMYKDLLAKKKISVDGPAHRRLKRLMNEEDWWDKL